MAIVKLKQVEKSQVPLTVKVIRELMGPIWVIGLFSFLLTILALAVPLYMMNLFDRVLTSQSIETLFALTFITLGFMVTLGLLEGIRSRALVRLGVRFDEVVGEQVFNGLARANVEQKFGGATLGQVDVIRGFLGSQTLTAFFDVPFVPIFIGVLFLLHPMLGLLGVVIAVAVLLLGLSAEWACRREKKEGLKQGAKAARFADNALRNAEVATAMGMVGPLRRRWQAEHNTAVDTSTHASDVLSNINGAFKAFTMVGQVLMLATACYLVLQEQVTAGALFASNVLIMRGIAPLNAAVGAWRGFMGARDAFDNLTRLLATVPADASRLRLPAPHGLLDCDRLTVAPPGGGPLILKGVSFTLQPGEALGVVGPNGSGKSTLARLLIGVWAPSGGSVRLDGADLYTWDADDLGAYVGYLPQDVGLFDGTIAENIARFGERNEEAIFKAARKAGIHEMVLQQPEGYDTTLRAKGGVLSGGQRQRVGLARAVYDDPRLVVLDEPSANLDREGERALLLMLNWLKRTRATVVVIAHDPRILKTMDKILMLQDGKAVQFGSAKDVLPKLAAIKGPVPRALPGPAGPRSVAAPAKVGQDNDERELDDENNEGRSAEGAHEVVRIA